MEEAFKKLPKYSILALEIYFKRELDSVYFNVIQVTEPILLGRYQGKAEYLLRLLKNIDTIKKDKKNLTNN
jgi:hypothetical protein